jgi:hypothetical protein
MRFTAEQITANWGAKCSECEPECYTCQVWAMFEEIGKARNAALEEAADIVEMRAANVERISCDVWLTDTQKRLYSSMEPLFLDAASAIRALKSEENPDCGNNVDDAR